MIFFQNVYIAKLHRTLVILVIKYHAMTETLGCVFAFYMGTWRIQGMDDVKEINTSANSDFGCGCD